MECDHNTDSLVFGRDKQRGGGRRKTRRNTLVGKKNHFTRIEFKAVANIIRPAELKRGLLIGSLFHFDSK